MTLKPPRRFYRFIVLLVCLSYLPGALAGTAPPVSRHPVPHRDSIETRLLAGWQRLQALALHEQDWLGQAWARLFHHDGFHDHLLNARLDTDYAWIDQCTLHEANRARRALYRALVQLHLAREDAVHRPDKPLQHLGQTLFHLYEREAHSQAQPAPTLVASYRRLLRGLNHMVAQRHPLA